ncbi:MAG: 2-polyprenyl-3-methyl-6-methoxy-1,4-benzoquinone monooxygenase [Gammaproteobacteria bacterium]|nr:2-polyprenyl-3-methyl-6-methoxy-1,4-benzoquinone monooxygenase [Gammaproteobacteria bacterium]
MPSFPQLTFADRCIIALDAAVGTVFQRRASTSRAYPAGDEHSELSESERRHSAGLMRVNHAGEIAAQALYNGQALIARDTAVREHLYNAANEENDHLAWCERRLSELHSRASLLAPLWYCGSLGIGALAGAIGDRWSLGFIAETEKQVVAHLDGHFEALPKNDASSRKIVHQMREDEQRHAQDAITAGGKTLPWPVQRLMEFTAKIMTTTAYYL